MPHSIAGVLHDPGHIEGLTRNHYDLILRVLIEQGAAIGLAGGKFLNVHLNWADVVIEGIDLRFAGDPGLDRGCASWAQWKNRNQQNGKQGDVFNLVKFFHLVTPITNILSYSLLVQTSPSKPNQTHQYPKASTCSHPLGDAGRHRVGAGRRSLLV